MNKNKLKRLADYAVREGTEHTTDGRWSVSYDELYYHFGEGITDANENGKLLEEELRQREEINELIMTEDAIEMLRAQSQELSDQLHIPMQDLKWFAAFHNEGHHPHVHLMVYSTNRSEGFLSKSGIDKLRSSIAREIFHQDLIRVPLPDLCSSPKQSGTRSS